MPTGFPRNGGGLCKRCGDVYKGHYQTHRKNDCKNPLEWGKKDKKSGLTHRQKQVWKMKEELDAAGRRKTNKQIAEELGIRVDTVGNTLYAARSRLAGMKEMKLGDLPRNRTRLQALEYVSSKLVNELVDRVKNKKKLEGVPNDELIALVRGVSQGIQMEVEHTRGGNGHEGIRLNASPKLFGDIGAEETEDPDATEETLESPEETT